jgi:hypothetical protein
LHRSKQQSVHSFISSSGFLHLVYIWLLRPLAPPCALPVHATVLLKLRSLGVDEMAQLAPVKLDADLVRIEVVIRWCQGLSQTRHIAQGMQRAPGLGAGLALARLEDEEQGVEARGQTLERGAEDGGAGGKGSLIRVQEVPELAGVGLWQCQWDCFCIRRPFTHIEIIQLMLVRAPDGVVQVVALAMDADSLVCVVIDALGVAAVEAIVGLADGPAPVLDC